MYDDFSWQSNAVFYVNRDVDISREAPVLLIMSRISSVASDLLGFGGSKVTSKSGRNVETGF